MVEMRLEELLKKGWKSEGVTEGQDMQNEQLE